MSQSVVATNSDGGAECLLDLHPQVDRRRLRRSDADTTVSEAGDGDPAPLGEVGGVEVLQQIEIELGVCDVDELEPPPLGEKTVEIETLDQPFGHQDLAQTRAGALLDGQRPFELFDGDEPTFDESMPDRRVGVGLDRRDGL
jgi:hypothetical protein